MSERIPLERATKARKRGVLPAPDEQDPLDYRLAFLPHNDSGNAARLLTRQGDDLIYVDHVGWHWWDGKRWNGEAGSVQARLLALKTAEFVGKEASALAKAKGSKAVPTAFVDEHRQWALDSGNAGRIRSMLELAQPQVTRPPTDFDCHPLLLNLPNGTLPLDGMCEATAMHRRADLITKIIEVEMEPEAKAPRFEAFLEEILPDREVRSFMQRSLGYALTGDASEQKMWVLHGTGANGKSTLIDLVARILGPYAVSLPFASFIADDRKRGGDATPDLAMLPGARLVRASEPDKTAVFSEGLIKTVTGGEEMPVRRLHQDFFRFRPEFKLFLSVNKKPRIRGQDEGIWRRIFLVPFTVQIPEGRRDKHFGEKLWQTERAGVLNWLISGLLEWRRIGLKPPPAVLAATQQYREESNPLAIFLESWCVKLEGAETQATLLYEAYVLWCRQNAVDPVTLTLFGKLLPEQGIEKRTSGTVRYIGIQLTDAADIELSEDRRRRAGHRRRPEGEGRDDD